MSKPVRRKPTPEEATPDAGVDLNSASKSTSPEMPHERDQHTGMTDGVPSARVQQAGRDLKRGVQDTSRGDEADSAYRKLKK